MLACICFHRFLSPLAVAGWVGAAEPERPLMHLRVSFYLVKQKKRRGYAGKGKQSASFIGPWQRDDSSRWILLVLLSCTDLVALGRCHTLTHTHWTMLSDSDVLFPFKLPPRFLADTCLNQWLPLQVMGPVFSAECRPPLKSTKINTIIEIFSSWLHWGLGLGWLLSVRSPVARGSKSSCIIWFLLPIWKRRSLD